MRFKILLIEDEKDICDMICNTLSLYAYLDVDVAYNAEDGYDKYLNNKPDLIITDLNLPNMCGLDLIEKIRTKDDDVRIIISTGHDDKKRLLRATTVGLSAFLIKPISIKDLVKRIDIIIENKNKIGRDENLIYFNEDCYFNKRQKKLLNENLHIKLTLSELKLLEYFMVNINIQLSSVDIFFTIWDIDKEFNQTAVRTIIKKLRAKLPKNCIKNIYGGYYRFVC